MQVSFEGVSVQKARRTERPTKVSKRGEARLLRIVRKSRGNILKDITAGFNNGNQGEHISERTVTRIFHNN